MVPSDNRNEAIGRAGAAQSGSDEYLVEGALVECNFGSHTCFVLLPENQTLDPSLSVATTDPSGV